MESGKKPTSQRSQKSEIRVGLLHYSEDLGNGRKLSALIRSDPGKPPYQIEFCFPRTEDEALAEFNLGLEGATPEDALMIIKGVRFS